MPIQIHGKEYKTVAERLEEAKDDIVSITTEVLFQEPVVIQATVTTKKGEFTGISAANPTKLMEKTSPYEVAETSAVGRALAFAGYAGSEIASAEELQKAVSDPTDDWIKETKDTEVTVTRPCLIHNVDMTQKKGANGVWFSHKLPNGVWCNGPKNEGTY